MPHKQEPTSSYLIIGAGNFGAATALVLAKRGHTKVTLVDTTAFPNPRAASHDINKIVRDDYPDSLYMRMLMKAMPQWREEKLYKKHYHEVGMLRADNSDFGVKSIASYKAMGIKNESELLPVAEVRRRWNGAFATTNFGKLSHILYNPSVGFAEADKALGAVLQEAVNLGVEYKIGEAHSLEFGPNGECIGVELKSGSVLTADKILLATGARTATLLAQSAPTNKELHAGDRLKATGAVSFHAKLQGAQKEKFSTIPVLKNCLEEVKGEGMSILKDGTIKFNCDMCFTNQIVFEPTGENMSVVPEESRFNVWDGPEYIQYFRDRAKKTIEALYGKEVAQTPVEAYRMCWDASTPSHDFLITPHPHCDKLYIASGGSFHGWKFLPVIGDYVADMMDGTLDSEYSQRWAWDKVDKDMPSANPTYKVSGDLQEWV